jgi:hypothetical protein
MGISSNSLKDGGKPQKLKPEGKGKGKGKEKGKGNGKGKGKQIPVAATPCPRN